MKNRIFLFLAMVVFVFSANTILAEDKLTAEEIIKKHLDSIGTVEKRNEIKNRIILGVTNFSVLRSPSTMSGPAVIASEDRKTLIGINFGAPSYPFEKVVFDGDKAFVAFITPGNYSALGNFLLGNELIITNGLLGGSLQSSWGIQHFKDRKAKIEVAGKKRIEGKETFVVNYFPNGGGNITIKLYFDIENFRHLRTEYRQYMGAQQGGAIGNSRIGVDEAVNNSAKQQETRNTLFEEFSDFKDQSGLILPQTYKVYLSLEGTRGTREFEWKFELKQFMFNQKFDPNSFEAN